MAVKTRVIRSILLESKKTLVVARVGLYSVGSLVHSYYDVNADMQH